jgi:hypothetical protein
MRKTDVIYGQKYYFLSILLVMHRTVLKMQKQKK